MNTIENMKRTYRNAKLWPVFLMAHFCSYTLPCIAQHVGIGTATPAYPLDVAGRMHFFADGQQHPGIYFDGSLAPNRAFLGHRNDQHIGVYGAGINPGWVFSMNFSNGNTAIGPNLPSAILDIEGSFRLRTPGSSTGAIVASADINGNTTWIRPVAFKVAGVPDPSNVNNGQQLPNGVWVKPEFTTITEYNMGLAWEPINQVFVAPRNGIYHFDGHFFTTYGLELAGRIIRTRNNQDTDMHTAIWRNSVNGATMNGDIAVDFCTEMVLNAGDKIRVELRGTLNPYGSTRLGPGGESMSFSGRMVAAL